MERNIRGLWARLWEDDGGAIISTEYMMLGATVVLGGAAGLQSLRDASVQELKETGAAIRAVRQHYTPNLARMTSSQIGSQRPAPATSGDDCLACP